MTTTITIPRFLLPRGEAILRSTRHSILYKSSSIPRHATNPILRYASTAKSIPKPIPKAASNILAKPERFNPPSHPSKLVKPAPIRQYGPAITSEEKETHKTKQYPHMAPPKGSFMDRFLNNRILHTMIALSVLGFFAAWTMILNFRATSPYAGQMPGWNDWFRHPIDSGYQFASVFKLHVLHDSEISNQKRMRMINETMKTKAYRVMHGLEPLEGQPTEVKILVAKMKGEYVDGKESELQVVEEVPPQRRPIKKWFGIW